MFRGKVGDAVFEGIAKATVKERPAGFIIPDDSLRQMMATCGETFSTATEADVVVGDFHKDGLPHEVRLMDRMPGVRDQGQRGTCTAFASVALCEFAEGCETELSPQFLYWASKERDGSPNHDGTYLDTVQSVLHEIGVCEERLWPYNAMPKYDEGVLNAGQGPAPEEAVEDAHNHKVSCRALSPKSVREFRKLLAAGYPVVVGLTTFRSWTVNPITAETGWVPMPYMRRDKDGNWYPLEKAGGGHAMCLVGYVDNKSAAGGGYFIVRNSWGEAWASECEEGAGHALIPYRYVALFCHSAFTLQDADGESGSRGGDSPMRIGPAASSGGRESSMLDEVPPNLRPFAWVLDREARDFRRALLPQGACVLSLTPPVGALVEYRKENFNTKEFKEILTQSRYPDKSRWTAEFQTAYNAVLSRKQQFCAKIEENLAERSLRLKPFPEFKFSWNLFPVMGSRRIAAASVVADFSDSLFDALLAEAVPSGECVPEKGSEWYAAMRQTVSAKIHKVSSLSLFPTVVYAVEVFATPFEINRKTGRCDFTSPTPKFVETVRKCAAAVLATKKKGEFVFFSIGTALPLAAGVEGIRESANSITVCGYAEGTGWEVRRPSYLTGQTAFRDFCDRLMPVTREDVLSAIKSYVDCKFLDPTRSAPTVGEIINHLSECKAFRGFPAFRQTVVIRMSCQLRDNARDKYAVVVDPTAQDDAHRVLVGSPELAGIFKPYKARNWLANLLLFHSVHLIGLLVCAAIYMVNIELLKVILNTTVGQVVLSKVILPMFTMFVSSFVQSKFNRLMTAVERD